MGLEGKANRFQPTAILAKDSTKVVLLRLLQDVFKPRLEFRRLTFGSVGPRLHRAHIQNSDPESIAPTTTLGLHGWRSRSRRHGETEGARGDLGGTPWY